MFGAPVEEVVRGCGCRLSMPAAGCVCRSGVRRAHLALHGRLCGGCGACRPVQVARHVRHGLRAHELRLPRQAVRRAVRRRAEDRARSPPEAPSWRLTRPTWPVCVLWAASGCRGASAHRCWWTPVTCLWVGDAAASMHVPMRAHQPKSPAVATGASQPDALAFADLLHQVLGGFVLLWPRR